ncbi:uncharacterized protein LOC142887799 isoform X1 [Nelusetta ayraudi]|uniref:uncharacterized protein LOC142887799 isoform X1 n=1 Tax=Nelusetta ayraudi TaxID=303726 RepID=UPI003F6F2F8F
MSLSRCGLVLFFIVCLTRTPAATSLPVAVVAGALRDNHHCREESQYLDGNICCMNCPPGQRVTSACTAEGSMGGCQECEYGTFMEHSNGLKQCFRCTQCRSDQYAVVACVPGHDTKCECKAGSFCSPEEPCEVCRKCSSCGEDEELVRNCTPTSNSDCKKVLPPKTDSPSTGTNVIIAFVIPAAALLLIVAASVWWFCRKTGSGRSLTADQQPAPRHRPLLVRSKPGARSTTEDHKTLCESLGSSASNSQYSLVSFAFPAPPRGTSPLTLPPPTTREEEPFPLLVAVNGEESLRRCFDYFVQVDIDYHRRFFRSLGLDDNLIKSKDYFQYEDRIHELLNVWIEKTGRDASINHLLRPLLQLDQRRTAENIKEKALESGHYRLDQS